jgi:hypothetical protein
MNLEEISKYFGKSCRLENHLGETLEGVVVLTDREGWVMLDWGFAVRSEEIAKIEEVKVVYH